MTENTCPYLDKPCPKVEDLEDTVARMEATQRKMLYLLYAIAGIVASELGVVLI